MRVKQAKLKDYVPFKGSDGETSSDVDEAEAKGDGPQSSQPNEDYDDGEMMSAEEA
tara:strand:- start:2514 stop:2681 length:168 start_codon:yes stop_codon:yes gene_type:complete